MLKKYVQKIIGFMLSITMIATIFVGCSKTDNEDVVKGNEDSKTEEKSIKQKMITIQFWHHYNAQSPENKTLNETIIPEFEKKFSNVKVEAIPHEWDQLHKKILISASSNQLPDVARIDIIWVPEFENLNILVPLDKDIDDFNNTKEQILDGPMDTARVKGNYYGLGLNTNTKILFYNEKMFTDASLEVPKTLDDFFEISKKLSSKNGNQQIWGYAEPALAGWNMCPFIWSNGGDIMNEDYTKASGYLNSDKNIELMQKLAELYKEEAMAGFNKGDIPLTDGFAKDRYAMIIEGPWKFAELETSYPDFDAQTAQMPSGDGGSVQVLGGEDIVMFNTTKNKDMAWEFMKFMTDEFAQINMAKVGQIPVNKFALESEDVKCIGHFAPFLEAIKTAKARPAIATWPQIDEELQKTFMLAITGEMPVKEALDNAAKKIDELLK